MATDTETTGGLFVFDEPSVEPPEPAAGLGAGNSDTEDEPEGDTVTLVASLPFFLWAYAVETEDGRTLVFDQKGTEVPTSEADQFIADAVRDGISLTRKAN